MLSLLMPESEVLLDLCIFLCAIPCWKSVSLQGIRAMAQSAANSNCPSQNQEHCHANVAFPLGAICLGGKRNYMKLCFLFICICRTSCENIYMYVTMNKTSFLLETKGTSLVCCEWKWYTDGKSFTGAVFLVLGAFCVLSTTSGIFLSAQCLQ